MSSTVPVRTGFRVGGIPVRVEPSFFLLVLFVAFSRDLASLAVWAGVVFVGVLGHELGHAFVYRAFGKEPRIELVAMGGLTWAVGGPALSAARQLAVSLAGPGAGFGLGALAYAARHSDSPLLDHRLVQVALADLLFVSVVWGVLNLVPILPLDGGRVMQSLLDMVTKGRGERPALAISVLVGAAGGVAALVFGQVFIALFAGFFVFMNAKAWSRSRPPPSQRDYASWLEEGYQALRQGARLAASNRAREILAGSTDPELRSEAATLLMWVQLVEGNIDEALETLAANPAAAGRPVLTAAVEQGTGGRDKAVELLAAAHRARPGDAAGALLARALVEAGRMDEASELALAEDPAAGPNTRAVVGAGLFRSGRLEEAARLGEVSFRRDGHPLIAYNVACCRARQGQPDQAMAWLELAVGAGFGDLAVLDADADLAVLRDRPGFDDLRLRVGSSRPAGAVCYRHPQVAVNLGCPSCQRPICERCTVATSAGWLCQECLDEINRGPRQPLPVGVVALLAVNATVFLAQQLRPEITFRYAQFNPFVADGQWYRLVTATMLHANPVHLLFNSVALWWYGRPLEKRLGTARLLAVYGVAGIAGSAASYGFGGCRAASLGASGAVLGTLGAMVAHSWVRRDQEPANLRQLGIAIAVIMAFGFFGPVPTDNLAHIGGLVAGGAVGLGFEAPSSRGRRTGALGLAAVALTTAAAIALVVWRTTASPCGGLGA